MRALLPLLLLVGCKNDSGLSRVADHYGRGDGSISGRVCDEVRGVWLPDATVYTHVIDDSGELRDSRQATTDEEGRWKLEELAAGVYTVYVQYGSSTLDMFDVTVIDGEDTPVDEPNCSGSRDLEVAVVTGDFDDFETVLQNLGIAGYHLVDGQTGAELVQFLGNAEQLAAYDAVFFAGGHLEEGVFYSTDGAEQQTADAVVAGLQAYVDAGGVVIASDWSYDVLERAWPRRVEFYGDDAQPDAAQVGIPGGVEARVEDPELRDAVGHDRVNITFDLDAWPVVESVDSEVRVLLTARADWQFGTEDGSTSDSPVALDWAQGDGRVAFTPWRMLSNLDGTGLETVRWIVDQQIAE
ncbi:MAG: carboxypeptidase regulatory-like domain-containing protein [Myxococcota bacterium]